MLILFPTMAGNFDWIGKSSDGENIVLKRFSSNFNFADYAADGKAEAWMQANPDLVRTAIVLDTETTGMNKKTDVIIELGIRLFYFNKDTGDLLKVGDSYCELQDPGQPLSPVITKLTGLTNDALVGKSIDWGRVDEIFTKADLIIAHNAAFDRPFVERKSAVSPFKIWACTFRQIDWNSKFSTSKLELLSIYHGFFTDAHRALNDADALLHLLSFKDRVSGKTYLNELITNARRPMVKIFAFNSPFESKDILRGKSYFWDSENRVWVKIIYKDELEPELKSLQTEVYSGPFAGRIADIPFKENFKQ